MARLRPATPDDADALAQTVSEGFDSYRAFAPGGWEPPDRLELALGIAVRLQDEFMRSVVAEEDGTVAGQAAWLPAAKARQSLEDPSVAHLGQLFVRRAWWGSGLAIELLDWAVHGARAAGYDAMRLFTPVDHLRARRFYEREGWALSGEPFVEQPLGLAIVEMRRPLG